MCVELALGPCWTNAVLCMIDGTTHIMHATVRGTLCVWVGCARGLGVYGLCVACAVLCYATEMSVTSPSALMNLSYPDSPARWPAVVSIQMMRPIVGQRISILGGMMAHTRSLVNGWMVLEKVCVCVCVCVVGCWRCVAVCWAASTNITRESAAGA